MTAKTSAQRQAELKQRRKEAGLQSLKNLWVHPEDVKMIREYAARLSRKRERAQKEKP